MIEIVTKGLIVILAGLSMVDQVHAQKGETADQIERYLAMPDDSINIGFVCLTLAKDAYPNLAINKFDRILDYMAGQISYLNEGRTDPLARIGLLNTYFYRKGWWNDSVAFTYDLNDLDATKRGNRYLNGYLSTKRGSCITMSMLYLAVADRLHWPVVAIRAAKHIFCRYIAPVS